VAQVVVPVAVPLVGVHVGHAHVTEAMGELPGSAVPPNVSAEDATVNKGCKVGVSIVTRGACGCPGASTRLPHRPRSLG
jgi:hypothetical protein